VLRCVRGGDGSAHCVAPPSGVKPRPFSGSGVAALVQ
jgi:hypothetical protein